ncbi:MAG: ABC transporter substrate-binding protein [Actinomycetota bacterium]|nr:ABC transporter substrate-binding protein [Actinomycetota bacterium]
MPDRSRLAILAVTTLLAAACSSSPGTGGGSAVIGGEEQSGRAAAERLTVGVAEDAGPLNLFAGTEEALAELVYDKLLAPNPYVDEPQPWLAERVHGIDASTWEVTLRDDVTWHDGEALTADDVAFTIRYFKEAPTGRWTHHVSDIPTIESVEVVDGTTVRLGCAFPCPDLGRITLADLPIIPEHVWDGVSEPSQVSALPVGTGPYRLVAYDATAGYRFEANPGYFAGAPVVGELVMPVIEDPSATFTALRTGEIDAAARPVPPELLEAFAASDDIEVAATAPLQFLELRLNYERPPFDVERFRHALSLAIDRQQLLDSVLLGQGRPATEGYPHPDSPWTSPELSTPFDLGEAEAVLDDLGYVDGDGDGLREAADGAPLAFSVKVDGGEPTHVRAAELVGEQLGAVGVGLRVEPLDAAALSNLFRSRDFDTAIGTIGAHGVADPTQFIMSHRSGYLWKAPELAYPEWDALFEEWRAATTVEARTEVLFEMQELFNRQPTSIPLAYPDEHWAFRPGAFDGWVESPSYGIVHKWSFLPHDVGHAANAITREF